MKENLIIFGSGDIAELAKFYFERYSHYKVKCFCVDEKYLKESKFAGIPLISFDEACKKHAPVDTSFFIALGYSKVNQIRKEKYLLLKKMGYSLATFISPQATVLSENKVGDNCFILENNTIQPFVKIGNNVTLWSGNHIGHHSTIGDHTFVSSQVVISGKVQIGENCFLGVNASIRDNIKIGDQCIIGAGTLILNNVESNGVYYGIRSERSKVNSKRITNI